MIDQIVKQVTEQIMARRDEEILDALGRLGHKFKAKKELHQFIENHCHVVRQGNQSTLMVDGEPVATWSEKIKTEIVGRTINVTIG